MKKIYISANQLQHDSFALAKSILQSGYQPTVLIGLWRGGAPVAITVHEALDLCAIKCDHMPLSVSSYQGINDRNPNINIRGLEYLETNLTNNDRLLIVDDVHDTGLSMQALIKKIKTINNIAQIKIATVYYKPEKSTVNFKPDFYIHETNDWIVFPHELVGLSAKELENEKPVKSDLKDLLIKYKN